MSATGLIVFGIVIVTLLVAAIFLLNGKGAFLIAGYNTMSKGEKEKYDDKALCRFVGWLLIAISFCMVFITAGIYFEIAWLTYCGSALIIAVTIGAIIYANVGNHFHNNDISETSVSVGSENSKSKSNKMTVIASIAISALVFIAVGILLYQCEQEPVVNVLDNSIQIEAMYGIDISFSDITNISLIEKSMSDIGVGRRTNGYGGFGETLKGHFKSDGLGDTLLFVQSKSLPTIRIEHGDNKSIYISFRDDEKTVMLYHEMIQAVTSK